jgi:uncharacterized protein YbaP (TraB family)
MNPFSYKKFGWFLGRRQWLLLAFLLGFGAQTAVAQGPLFLWKVTSNAAEVYLLGSIHLAKPDMYPLDARIEEAFRASDDVVVEVDVSGGDMTQQRALALQLGMYSDGFTVKDHLSPEGFVRFQRFLEERSLPLPAFQGFRPWMLASMLQILEMQRVGFDTEIGIERHFLRLSEQQGKVVHELETAEFQLRMLAEMSDELQELFLISTIDEYASFAERIDRMIVAWKIGDSTELANMLLKDYAEKPEMRPLYQRILIDRNVGMAQKIVDMLEGGGKWFVIVGAAHLVGEEGLVEILQQDAHGFQVMQVGAADGE